MRRYTVLTPLAVPGRRDPLPPGSPVEMEAAKGDKLVDKGILARAADAATQSPTIDAAALAQQINTLEGRLAETAAALDAQVEVTRAAERRALAAEAELATLRAEVAAAPPAEPPPVEQKPEPEPKAKPKAK